MMVQHTYGRLECPNGKRKNATLTTIITNENITYNITPPRKQEPPKLPQAEKSGAGTMD